MRVVLSRKGFDSEAGGVPSPIIDGKPISLPIPTHMPTPVTYGALNGPFAGLVSDLTRRRKRPLTADSPCHLDPDLDASVLPRAEGWRGAFGQTDSAQSHLARQGISTGDLFLFWGRFRHVERKNGAWRFVGPEEHRIFGWLQIDSILLLGPKGSAALDGLPWLRDHPHARNGWTKQNTIYVARDRLEISGCAATCPGWGVFSRGRRLTAANVTPSIWQAPEWLHPTGGGTGMSHHKAHHWLEGGRVQTVARGQEFVAHVETQAVAGWLDELFADGGASATA